jgi:hypothetical protein
LMPVPGIVSRRDRGRTGAVRIAAEGCRDKNIQAHAGLSVDVSVIGAEAGNVCDISAVGWRALFYMPGAISKS